MAAAALSKNKRAIPFWGQLSRPYKIMTIVMVSIILLIIGGLTYIVVDDRQAAALEITSDIDETDQVSYDVNDSDMDDDFVVDDDSLTSYDVTFVEEEVEE